MIEAGHVRGRKHLIRYAARPGASLDRLLLLEPSSAWVQRVLGEFEVQVA